jgi:6-phosphogluconolactonase
VSTPSVLVHRDPDELAAAVAARLITRLVDVQSARGAASLVLTGGGIARRTLEAVAGSPARGAVDWRRLDVWWGDERFLPSGDPERNETQARAALLDRLDLDPERVHAVPGPDSPHGATPEAAADWYAAQLAARAEPGEDVPRFDVLMLGVGPDCHVASLFPEHPALHEEGRSVVGVHDSPKPPPTRVSLTFRALGAARDVWFLVAGADKAGAVGLALSGAGRQQAPAAGVSGTRSTTWLIDRPAAEQVPSALVPTSSA